MPEVESGFNSRLFYFLPGECYYKEKERCFLRTKMIWRVMRKGEDISIFTELCRALNASADLLLGLGKKDNGEINDENEILKNLRCSLAPLALLFGKDLVRTFLDSPYAELIFEQRRMLSREGIQLPVVRLQDELRPSPNKGSVAEVFSSSSPP